MCAYVTATILLQEVAHPTQWYWEQIGTQTLTKVVPYIGTNVVT